MQSYPSAPPPPAAQPQPQPQRPRTVQTAVVLMYAGAAISALTAVLSVVGHKAIRKAIVARLPHVGATALHRDVVAAVAVVVIVQVIGAALWLWMAWANGRGRGWARIVSAVLFGLFTLDVVGTLVRPRAAATLVVILVLWLVALVTTILLFLRESRPFFQQRTY
jgi:hypothetical protein